MITSSTVGFGDVCPRSELGRAFTIFTASYGLSTLIHFANKFEEAVAERQAMLKQSRQLNLEISDPALLVQRLDESKDGVVDRYEYLVGMLTALEMVPAKEIQAIMKRFDALDTDGSGTLTTEKLLDLFKTRAAEVNGFRQTKENAAPTKEEENKTRAAEVNASPSAQEKSASDLRLPPVPTPTKEKRNLSDGSVTFV